MRDPMRNVRGILRTKEHLRAFGQAWVQAAGRRLGVETGRPLVERPYISALFHRSAVMGQRGTRGLSVTYLPSSVSFRKSLKSSFYALASFGGVGGESPCSEVKASRCLDCSWPEMNHFV